MTERATWRNASRQPRVTLQSGRERICHRRGISFWSLARFVFQSGHNDLTYRTLLSNTEFT